MTVEWVVVVGFTLAAALGAVIRYVVGAFLNNEFPYGTLLVNLASSAALGFMVGAGIDPQWFVVVAVGGMGALSTWSTAATEAADMARRNEGRLALAYLAMMVLTGILVAWIGIQVGRSW